MFIDFKLVDDEFFWMFLKMVVSLGLELICDWNSFISGFFSVSGMVSRVAIVFMVDRFSSFCFLNFCFIEFVFICNIE